MKMTNCMSVVLAVAACALAAHVAAANPPRRPARLTRPSGGLVEKPYAGKVLRFADAQSAVDPGLVASAVESVRRQSRLPLVVSRTAPAGGALAWKAAQELASADGVGAAVLVADVPELPFLVASPDGRWAVLNVAVLRGDAARAPGRLAKLVWHAAALALGAGGAGDAGVLAPFSGVRGLDALACEPGPAAHNALVDAARARGVGLVTLATYRQACEEGWAPTPTNDIQRAIWEKVHAIPSKPMKIEFDPKRGR